MEVKLDALDHPKIVAEALALASEPFCPYKRSLSRCMRTAE
jgi:hypothetical protein